MVRSRIIQLVKQGHMREEIDLIEELNRVLKEKGLKEGTCWVSFGGILQQLIIEYEYPTLADYERELDAFFSDSDLMKVWRGSAQHIVEGSGREELMSTAPALA